jgi:hypothetical protein
VANNKEKNQSLTTEVNEYEKARQRKIEENRKKLQELGIENKASSRSVVSKKVI